MRSIVTSVWRGRTGRVAAKTQSKTLAYLKTIFGRIPTKIPKKSAVYSLKLLEM